MAGENVILTITGINQNDIKEGDIICNNLNYCMNTYEFKASINLIQNDKEIK
jgi:translation elongation factor EF-1alpha